LTLLGYADDAIVVAPVRCSVIRRSGLDAVIGRWSGTPDGPRCAASSGCPRELS
jgi:hypothetical protein